MVVRERTQRGGVVLAGCKHVTHDFEGGGATAPTIPARNSRHRHACVAQRVSAVSWRARR